MVVSRSMPSFVIAGFRRRSANSSNPFCDSHTSMIRNPVSVGWEICWYIPGSGRASTPISSSIARNSLWVKPVTFIVITTVSILFFLILISPFSLLLSLMAGLRIDAAQQLLDPLLIPPVDVALDRHHGASYVVRVHNAYSNQSDYLDEFCSSLPA